IPGGGLFPADVADLIALATNRFASIWIAAPGLATLETNVIAWFAKLAGLPEETSGGLLTSGGSIANLVAVVTARRERLPPAFLEGTLYASDQVHHPIKKAALIGGFPPDRVREIPTDARHRIDLRALAEAIAADRARGAQPFLVVGSAGTTSTGAVDDLEAL